MRSPVGVGCMLRDGSSGAAALSERWRALLNEQRFYNLTMHIGQTKIATLKSVSQLRVIQAEQMQNRRVQIVDVDFVFDRVKTEFVRLPVGDARFDSAAGEPDGVAVRMMVAPN